MEELQSQSQNNNQLFITNNIKKVLLEVRKWSKFIAILGFIGIGFMLILGIIFALAGSIIEESTRSYQNMPFDVTAMGFFYTLGGIIYFIPLLFLLNFSNKLKVAINGNDPYSLYAAFNNLRLHYKFVGIVSIVMFALVFIIIFIGVIIGVVAALG